MVVLWLAGCGDVPSASCSPATRLATRRGSPTRSAAASGDSPDAVGLPNVRLHDLRHYVATRLLAAGVDVRTVAGRLGHRNAATTLNVYSHFVPEADRQAADVLADCSTASGSDVYAR